MCNDSMEAIPLASPLEAVLSSPPTSMEGVSVVVAFPLLSLPEHLLALVVSKVQGGKNGLRTTCRSLRLAVNDCTSALVWTHWTRGGPVLHANLNANLKGACPAGIKLLDCHGQRDARLEFSFASFPLSLFTLLCSCTRVRLLEPLAVRCTMLRTLNFSNTMVSDLGPLSACTTLQTFDCRNCPRVSDLGPLSACTMLQTLHCSKTRVSDLGPLSSCTVLRILYCSNTKVSDLGPLSSCTMLQTLNCSDTKVSKLGPLSACTMLQALWCSCESLPRQARGLQAVCPSLRINGMAIAGFGQAA